VERKLATVLFVDLVGSTALVSGADPEVVRRRMTRFFDEVSHGIETHGGFVEKYAGDAVLAVFGVPQAHEDDAERAVRAALAIQESVRELQLEARVGIEAGEIVVEDGDSTFATGEAVNLAARLQQEAGPGEILVGPAAHGLALGRLEAEEAGSLVLKGVEGPVPAWRVLCATDGDRSMPGVAAPLIGREAELELLANAFSRTTRDRRAQLFTIYGDPGVGKSRLAREFVEALEGTTVLAGRCLPYGEGVTYWPLAEMVKSAAGISDDDPIDEAFAKLKECCEDEAVADLLGLASGVLEALEEARGQQEIAWAASEWAEQLADAQPLVLAFEDIQWAEEPLLELVEHLADSVRAPVLIVCLARPELLEVRPGWGGGRIRATAIELEVLGSEDSERLVEALVPVERGPLPEEARRQLLEKTEGNPLFLEETIRMIVERGGDGSEGIPDTLQALIAARIDRLRPDERALLRRAAVIGRVFWGGALAHLSPSGEDIGTALDHLVRRDLVLRESRSTITGEEAYRFRHVLIREVAYAGLSKSARAEHHARFAEWLRERAGDELLEIRAYHLDHAVTLLNELDGVLPEDLTGPAAAALAKAGMRALSREANRSARKLLLRAVELEPTLERRYQAARAAWRLDELPAVSREMEQVATEAHEAGDRTLEGRALTALAEMALLRDADSHGAKALADRALAALEPKDRFEALRVSSKIARWEGDMDAEELLAREALELARANGHPEQEARATHELASVYSALMRYEEAQKMIERALELAGESGSILGRALALREAGYIQSMQGGLDSADALLEEARGLFAEVGSTWHLARTLNYLSSVAHERGDYARAEELLRESIKLLKPLEDRGTLCESQRSLADALLAQGKVDEAERLALEAIDTVGPHDVSSQASTRVSLGLVRAAQGRNEEGEQLLREAAELVAGTGYLSLEVWIRSKLDQFPVSAPSTARTA
jgi:class 3 adenylate cyclase/tetratricopeptide (TPR) repeat protein